MSLFLMCIAFGIVLDIANVESNCGGKYKEKFTELDGHCFFEPPDASYFDEINPKTPKYSDETLFSKDKSQEVCKRYDDAIVLQWDTTVNNSITEAIVNLAKSINKPIFVPCANKVTNYSQCYKYEKGIVIEEWWFIYPNKNFTTESSTGEYDYDKDAEYRSGLICHHTPKESTAGEGGRPTMAAFIPLLAMLIVMVIP